MRFLTAILLSLALTAPANAHPVAWWVQIGGAGAEVRAVTHLPQCPVLRIDGRVRPMHERASPDAAFDMHERVTPDLALDGMVCAAPLPAGAKAASLDGRSLPIPKRRPNRIVIFGDTGCRLDKDTVQGCGDPAGGWPFAKVAALAAAQRPDLVIHLGDYYYRERPCPAETAACAGSPFGDRWPTWKAELFDPAAPLLSAAPWVFVRGNHEDCRRGGSGWFRLLDADPKARACPAVSDPFVVELGGLRLAVLDSADADDIKDQPERAAAFAADLARIPAAAEPTWLVTHRPIWGLSQKGLPIRGDWGNRNMKAAAKAQGLAGVSLMLAGHVHNFTSLDFGAARPPELIVGAGGTALETGAPPEPIALDLMVEGVQTKALMADAYGYFVFDRHGRDWVGAFHNLKDQVVVRCRLDRARLTCVPAKP